MIPCIATVINFCSIEKRFIEACIEQCRHFSRQIVIPVCDHLFDGKEENIELIKKIAGAFPDCEFFIFPYLFKTPSKRMRNRATPAHFWHCVSRAVGTQFLKKDIQAILFLDADEIPDGQRFRSWLSEGATRKYQAVKLQSYWYFREPRYQAVQLEPAGLFVSRHSLKPSFLIGEDERWKIFRQVSEPKLDHALGLDGLPLIHHLSWVRTKQEMLEKVAVWGHQNDRNWKELVEKEFLAPFSGKDFVHGYSFREVSTPFSVSLEAIDFTANKSQLKNLSVIQEGDLRAILRRSREDLWGRLNAFIHEHL